MFFKVNLIKDVKLRENKICSVKFLDTGKFKWPPAFSIHPEDNYHSIKVQISVHDPSFTQGTLISVSNFLLEISMWMLNLQSNDTYLNWAYLPPLNQDVLKSFCFILCKAKWVKDGLAVVLTVQVTFSPMGVGRRDRKHV